MKKQLNSPRLSLSVSAGLVVATVALVGCTPDAYRRSADLQIDSLLRDRKRQTLSYQPLTEAPDKATPDAPGKGYQRIPVTPIPVSSGFYVEPTVVDVKAGPLGPMNVLPKDAPPPPVGDFQSSARERPTVDAPVLGPASPTRALVRLDLYGTLRYAVANSRDYADQMENLYLSALDVTLQRHLLSPRPFVSQTVDFSQDGENVAYRSALSATTNAGVRQRLPYGGEIVASSLVTFVNALQEPVAEGESAGLALTASLPLLRGAGFVNLEGLISSERQLVYSVRSFEIFRRAFLVDVTDRYFRVLTARSGVLNRRAQLDSQIDLVERSRALFAAGKGSFLDVQRSLNSQIQGESTLLQAEVNYRATLDDFKVFLGMDPTTDLELLPVEVDVSIPEVNPADAVRLAHLYRLDLQTFRDRIDDAKRNVENTKNGLLPDLNLNAGTNVNSTAGGNARQIDQSNQSYNAGVRLDLPVDRVAERNSYRRALIFFQQAQRDYEQARDNASVLARNALRRIRSARDRTELNRRNVAIAQARLDLANDLLRQPLLSPQSGLSPSKLSSRCFRPRTRSTRPAPTCKCRCSPTTATPARFGSTPKPAPSAGPCRGHRRSKGQVGCLR